MNSKARKYDYIVIGISAVIFAIIFVLSQIDQEGFVAALNLSLIHILPALLSVAREYPGA